MRKFCPALLTALLLGAPLLVHAEDERRILRRADVDEASSSIDYSAQASLQRHRAIEQLKPLIEGIDDARKPELLLRLAELYYDEGRYLRYTSEDIAAAEAWYASALRLYRLLIERYPEHPRTAEAMFALAATLEELDRSDEALVAWSRFVSAHPTAPTAAEAHLRLGELLLDRGEVFKAHEAYSRSLRLDPQARLAEYARFRLAWCSYNLGEYGDAIQNLRVVVFSSPEGTASLLREEATRDLVRMVAETRSVDDVLAEVQRLPVPAAERRRLTGRAAEVKRSIGEDRDAERLWLGLLADAPQGPEAAGIAASIVEMHIRAARYAAALDLLLRQPADGSDAQSDVLRQIATNTHAEARKRRTRALYETASRAYAAWLERYPAPRAETADVRYAYGELLYESGEYEAAYREYVAVVALGGEHAAFCAEAALFSAEKLLAAEDAPEPADREPIPLSAATTRYLAAAQQLLEVSPGHARTQAVLYRSAWLLYSHNQLDEAAQTFRQVIAMNPRSPEAQQASHLILDGLAQQEAWSALRDTARAFREAEGLGDARFRAELKELDERASFKVIESQVTTDPVGAARDWMGFAVAHPESTLSELALNNAAVYLGRMQHRAEAMEARTLLLERYPQGRYAAEHTAALGFDHESIADFEAAAVWYERLAAQHPEHPAAADALYSAALFRRALGEPAAALADMVAFTTRWPADTRAPEVALERAALLDSTGETAAAQAALRAFAERPPPGTSVGQRLYARVALGSALLESGQERAARQAWQQAVEEAEALGALDDPSHAGALCQLARLERSALERLHLRSWETVETDVTRMMRAFLVVEQAYGEAIRAGDLRWGLTAAVELGQAYEWVADAIAHSPRPPTQESWVEVYNQEIDDQVWTLQQRAARLYASAMERSFAVHFYDEPTAVALGRLQVLDPEAYPALSEDLIRAAFTTEGGTGVGFLETAE